MQLRYLAIPRFRNLRDVELKLATHLEATPGRPDDVSRPIRSHALIGQNGTGKSNLIEALITIFRNIDLDAEPAFDYTLEYEIRGHVVRIQANADVLKTRPLVWVDGEKVTQEYLRKNDPPEKEPKDRRRGPRLLPTHIFAYYSGRNERIETLFQMHLQRFTNRQEITTDEQLSDRDLARLHRNDHFDADAAKRLELQRATRDQKFGDDRLRRLFYCRGGHSQLVLLACLLSDDPVFQKVLKTLHIESLESALFVLKEPHRLRTKRREGKFEENELNEGDPRFWYARGNVVSEFLDKLWQVAWAPIAQEVDKQIDFRGRTEKQRQLYLYVSSQTKLKQLGELVGGTDSFFRYAEGAYIGDLIEEVRITVKKREQSDGHDGKVSFNQLSEGELQMLTVLGLMRITRDDHCLFLLDEPDTHMNPIWKLRLFDEIKAAMEDEQGLGAAGESQVLLTTHDPILLGGLKREQVHVIHQLESHTEIESPAIHPQGMGVTGLLKSELFGLSSTLDIETERRLKRRNDLFVKSPRTADEEAELTCLSTELADLGFSNADFRDPDYALFVRKLAEHRKLRRPNLTADEMKQQDAIADKIIEEILSEEEKDQ